LLGNIKVEAADLKNGMLRIYLMGQEEVSKKIRIAIE
jgi:HSP20 family molecular chaperone IbpA